MKISSPILLSFGLLSAVVVASHFLIGKDNILANRNCIKPAQAAEIAQSAPASNTDRVELDAAIDAFRRAMVTADTQTIRDFAMADLSFGHSNGHIQTMDEFIETVKSGEEVFKRVEYKNRETRITGDTALERHHFSADIVYQGKLMNFELEIVEIWRKTDHWRLSVRQAYKI